MTLLARMFLLCSFSFVALVVGSNAAEAKAKSKNPPPHIERELRNQEEEVNSGADADLVKAVNNQRRLGFVEGAGMVVIRVLPEDTKGAQHQKWIVRLSNGKHLQAVYNSDMCPKVPVQEGDVVAMGGEFIWTQSGGMLHWLHHDPRGRRPNGYVNLNGKTYCNE